MSRKILLSVLSMAAFMPSVAHACACGCGVFDVGTGAMMPSDAGGSVWLEYDYMNQSKNWSGTQRAPKENNNDKQIVTHFLTAGGQYMFNRTWGVQAEVPYVFRSFKTTDDDGNPAAFRTDSVGDVRIKGVYSGFAEDMSSGVTFGFKLPTGNSRDPNFDRDTQIGSGSTDWLLGGFHRGALTADTKLNWFMNGQWQHAFIVRDHYRPGDDWNAALGSYYNAGAVVGGDSIAPMLQLIGSYRLHDVGMNGDPGNSGYRRLLISPGLEYDVGAVRLYGDVEVPVYQNVNGSQLVSGVLTKFVIGYSF